MDKTNALSLRGDGTFRNGPTLTYLIDDEFTDTVAAGSVNGTAATPGPGTRTVTDTENKLSVGSGALAIAGGKATPAWGDPGLYYGAQTRSAGLAVLSHIASDDSGTNSIVGFAKTVPLGTRTTFDNAFHRPGGDYYTEGALLIGTRTDATPVLAVILRTSGAFYCVNENGAWRILWINTSASTSTVYPAFSHFSLARSADYLRVIALPSPFNGDDGIATDVLSGSVAAGTTFTHEADCLIEFTVDTLPSADSVRVRIRKADSTNYWFVQITSVGNAFLYEVISGTPVQVASSLGAVSNGHRVVVIADGTTIKVYSNNTLLITYSSASSSATATAGEVNTLGTGGAVSNVKTWPRELDGIAASVLNKASA